MPALNYVGVPVETSTLEPDFMTYEKDGALQSGDFVHFTGNNTVAKADGSLPIIGVCCANPDIDQGIYAYVMSKGTVWAVAPSTVATVDIGKKLIAPTTTADGSGGIVLETIPAPADWYYPDSDLVVETTAKVVKVLIGGQQ